MSAIKNSEQTKPHALVLSDEKAAGEKLSELAFECGFETAGVLSLRATEDSLRAQNANVLIVNASLKNDFLAPARSANASGMCVLLLLGGDEYERYRESLAAEGIMVIKKPTSRETVRSCVRLLAAVTVKLQQLTKSNSILLEKMEDIKVVSRAKWLLIGSLGMTEREAHYHIEKQAMDMRLPRREIAETIIRTYDK